LSAALLAAYHSSVKGGAKAAVDYTQVRNVDKIHGAKAGMVNYTNQKTVFVAASNEEVAKLRLVN
jgi:predicted ribosome quality control (RQC) complex YloA/Tae2 family protein